MGEVYGRDQHGHIWVRQPSGGDGCFCGLIVGGVLIIALIVGIFYGIRWAGMATGVIKPTPTPIPEWSVSLSPDSAQHSGNFATDIPNSNAEYPNGMRNGDTLTFTNINAPRDGTYTINLQARLHYGSNAPSYTFYIIVNGQTVAQLPINSNTVYPAGGEANSITKVSLQQGNTTIQLKLEGTDTSDDFYGTSFLNIESVDLSNFCPYGAGWVPC